MSLHINAPASVCPHFNMPQPLLSMNLLPAQLEFH
ncbi:hypothetical protein GCAAIG_13315 [Candidatus Electronema halotolerans]|jgi:hypothetical protein